MIPFIHILSSVLFWTHQLQEVGPIECSLSIHSFGALDHSRKKLTKPAVLGKISVFEICGQNGGLHKFLKN